MADLDDHLARVIHRLDARVDWERRDRSAGMRVDLAPARALCAALGAPERRFRAVHVAGSKGKGSTAAWLAAALARAGKRVGVYASPHVVSITERVRIDGEEIGREPFANALERALGAAERDVPGATWFDVVTVAAFLALAESGVEWAVVEAGLGGRLDSTNVLESDLCVLTGIELEHTAVLGDTREQIAAEKAGIAKRGVPFVCALEPDDPAAQVVAGVAREMGAPLVLAPPRANDALQARNQRLALVSMTVLSERLEDPRLEPELFCGLPAPALPGRLERRSVAGVPVVLDGAHTPDSLGLVLAELAGSGDLPGRPVVVLGVARDKPLPALLKLLAPVAETVVCSSAGSGPALSATKVAQAAREAGLDAETASDPGAAIQRALALAHGRWVLVTGSLHLVGLVSSHLPPPAERPCSPSSPTCS